MKHDDLRSLGHNIAASLASGVGLIIGVYDMDVFGEASHSPEGFITVDFLSGTTAGGEPTPSLIRAIELYRDALPELCAKQRVDFSEIVELTTRYSAKPPRGRFIVTVADRSGRRSSTQYNGFDGHREKMVDGEGRLRPVPVQRHPVEG